MAWFKRPVDAKTDIQIIEKPVADRTEGHEYAKRIQGYAIVPLPLRPEQIADFKAGLEELCNKFLNMDPDN